MASSRPANPLPRRLSSRLASSSTAGPTRAESTPANSSRDSLHINSHLQNSNHERFANGRGSSSRVSNAVNRSASHSPLILETDQHNSSSIALSPRAAPRARRKAISRRTASSAINGIGDESVPDFADRSSLGPHELSALQLPVPSDASSASARHTKSARRMASTPLNRHVNGKITDASGDVLASKFGTVQRADSSSASTSGILGGSGSVLTRSSSPPFEMEMESTNIAEHETTDDLLYDSDSEESDTSSSTSWTLIDRMRLWRNDALTQHLYTTSIFWSNKIFSKTKNPNDGFWLAQSYFSAGYFNRAERILTTVWERSNNADSLRNRKLDKGKGKGKESSELDDTSMVVESEKPQLEGDLSSRVRQPGSANTFATSQISTIQAPPTAETIRPTAAGASAADDYTSSKRTIRLTDISVACRYLAAQAMVRQEKWASAMEMLGEINPFKHLRNSGSSSKFSNESGDGGIKFEASMCHLRGQVQLHLNAIDRAKECFMEALSIDVKCYESFEALIGGNMLDVEEEWHFIQGLSFKQHTPEDAEFIKMMYTVRLKKYAHREEMAQCSQALVAEFGLIDDPDVLFGLADELYNAMRYVDCFAVTTRILRAHDTHSATLPLHLACMQHLPHLRSKLFLLAHELVDREPEAAISWYAAGLWYFSNKKWEEARRYFGKALLIDSRLGCAWMGFAHSFALEGEHDQAITAYSTAQRHFHGTHLPLMFIGMQYILLSNIKAAQEYLSAAYSMCKTDPLLLNERGVAAYYNERYAEAAELFKTALRLTRAIQSAPATWASTQLNLAQSYRKLGSHDQAIPCFEKVLELEPRNALAFSGLGVSLMNSGREEEAVNAFHEALSIQPGEPMATSLLRIALQNAVHTHPASTSASMGFPLLSDAAAEDIDARVREDEIEHYGRLLRNNHPEDVGSRTEYRRYQQPVGAEGPQDGYHQHQEELHEENENDDSTEDSAMVEASVGSDMVD